MKSPKILFLYFLFIFLFSIRNVFAYTDPNDNNDIEELLIKSLYEIADGNLNNALLTIDTIIEKKPNFKLAHLIKGDIYQAYAEGINAFGGPDNQSKEKLNDLKEEARQRIKSHLKTGFSSINSTIRTTLPENLQKIIYIDTSNSRLFIFEKDGVMLNKVFDVYASIGKNGSRKNHEGDKKTPIGIYSLEKKIKQPLSDFYGEGAYPINYPNSLDKLLNKTGHGIWIHGTPKNTYSRPPQSSDGCVVIANEDFINFERQINNNNVKVIISDESYEDYFKASHESNHSDFISAFNTWKTNWEAKNFDSYLAFYDSNAQYNFKNFKNWTDTKLKVFENSNAINVFVENFLAIDYPDDKDNLKFVEFKQTYTSNITNNVSIKQQIWRKFNNEWKIISEATR
jgi:murein L,D-transpeptidase YafK